MCACISAACPSTYLIARIVIVVLVIVVYWECLKIGYIQSIAVPYLQVCLEQKRDPATCVMPKM
jgi:hypothetical protein